MNKEKGAVLSNLACYEILLSGTLRGVLQRLASAGKTGEHSLSTWKAKPAAKIRIYNVRTFFSWFILPEALWKGQFKDRIVGFQTADPWSERSRILAAAPQSAPISVCRGSIELGSDEIAISEIELRDLMNLAAGWLEWRKATGGSLCYRAVTSKCLQQVTIRGNFRER
jgi:hypothetical protein